MQKILLVEDDKAISEMVHTYLTNEGFTIVPVFTGQEAVTQFKEEPFDLVLLDIMLPELNGMDFLHALRKKAIFPSLSCQQKIVSLIKLLD